MEEARRLPGSEEQIRLTNYINHLSKNLTIVSKLTVYHTVYLPTILYLYEIWADELKPTHIESELEYRRLAKGKDDDEKKRIRDEFMQKQMEGYDRFYLLSFDTSRVAKLRSKCAIWFGTAHGPFGTSKGRGDASIACRFYGKGREVPEHLLFSCRQLRRICLNRESFTIEEFERASRAISVKLLSSTVS